MYMNVRTNAGKWFGCLGIRKMGDPQYSYGSLYFERLERARLLL